MRVHILCKESVTPIERYLAASAAAPRSHARQKEVAALVLTREREYRGLFSRMGLVDRAQDDGTAFAPFPLTAAGATALARLYALEASAIQEPPGFDLFGLKADVAARLRATLRPVAAHGLGWLLLSQLLDDLARFDEAMDAARQAIESGETLQGLALLWSAAIGAARGDDGSPAYAVARRAERQGRAALRAAKRSPRDWPQRLRDAFDERVRQLAARTRAREEGDAFTKYWTTERAFCESQRAAGLKGFDESRVPPEFRPLIPLAQAFGVGDDVCRGLFLKQISRAERATMKEQVAPHATAVQQWLDSLGGPPYGVESSCFFWLLEAAEEA